MNGPCYARASRGIDYSPHKSTEFFRYCISDSVRNVERGSPAVCRRSEYFGEKYGVRPAGVLGGKFHILNESPGICNSPSDFFQHLIPCHLQLMLHVNGACGYEGVDPRFFRTPDR